jgi:hypothetical protein
MHGESPGTAVATSSAQEVRLQATATSADQTVLCWFQHSTKFWGVGNGIRFLKLLVSNVTTEWTRQDNNNSGALTRSLRAGVDSNQFTNTETPHLAVMVSNDAGPTTHQLYLNGVEVGSATAGGTAPAVMEVILDMPNMSGGWYDNSDVPFPMCVYQHAMAFDGVALSGAQILDLYNAGV